MDWSSINRNSLGLSLPGCGFGVIEPTSTKPKPILDRPCIASPCLSKPAARPIGFENFRLHRSVSRFGYWISLLLKFVPMLNLAHLIAAFSRSFRREFRRREQAIRFGFIWTANSVWIRSEFRLNSESDLIWIRSQLDLITDNPKRVYLGSGRTPAQPSGVPLATGFCKWRHRTYRCHRTGCSQRTPNCHRSPS